jgi:hypothetical protein
MVVARGLALKRLGSGLYLSWGTMQNCAERKCRKPPQPDVMDTSALKSVASRYGNLYRDNYVSQSTAKFHFGIVQRCVDEARGTAQGAS